MAKGDSCGFSFFGMFESAECRKIRLREKRLRQEQRQAARGGRVESRTERVDTRVEGRTDRTDDRQEERTERERENTLQIALRTAPDATVPGAETLAAAGPAAQALGLGLAGIGDGSGGGGLPVTTVVLGLGVAYIAFQAGTPRGKK